MIVVEILFVSAVFLGLRWFFLARKARQISLDAKLKKLEEDGGISKPAEPTAFPSWTPTVVAADSLVEELSKPKRRKKTTKKVVNPKKKTTRKKNPVSK